MIHIITGTEDGVRRFYVDMQKPLHALDALDRLMRTDMIESRNYDYAELCDRGGADLDWRKPDKYALKFKSKDRTEEIWFSAVTTGDRDSGTRATVQIMLLMDFSESQAQEAYCLPKGTKKVFRKKK